MQLASRFASRSPSLRSDYPLSDDQIHRVAPSIFADAPHESRSQRYAYIPTAAVLTELRKEGFQPFMVTQTRVVVKFFWTRRSGGGVMHRRATGWQGWPAFHTARVIGSQVLNAIGYCYKS